MTKQEFILKYGTPIYCNDNKRGEFEKDLDDLVNNYNNIAQFIPNSLRNQSDNGNIGAKRLW
jgi:hypothetical protein